LDGQLFCRRANHKHDVQRHVECSQYLADFQRKLGYHPGANPTGATWQFNFQLNSWQRGGPANTDTLTLDNIVLTVVPEPTTIALAGLGVAALWFFRRKV
jgi:hypothetical protein